MTKNMRRADFFAAIATTMLLPALQIRAAVLPDDAGVYTYSNVKVTNASLLHTFTIANKGAKPLSLTGNPRAVITGTNAADFVVTTQPAASIAAGGSTTFVIKFDPSALGTRTATVKIVSNDAKTSPYTFVVKGSGIS